MGGRRIGIFGGTFDPVHLGHLIMATELQFQLKLETVWFVPTGSPPHKPSIPISANEDRLRMLESAIANEPTWSIDPIELERNGPSFTCDTLRLLRDRHPIDDLVFLMGADSLRDLPTWKRPDEIIALAEIGVAARPGVEPDLEEIERLLPGVRRRVTIVEIPLIGISSRDIRRRVAANEPIRHQVTPEVEHIIREQGLYHAD